MESAIPMGMSRLGRLILGSAIGTSAVIILTDEKMELCPTHQAWWLLPEARRSSWSTLEGLSFSFDVFQFNVERRTAKGFDSSIARFAVRRDTGADRCGS